MKNDRGVRSCQCIQGTSGSSVWLEHRVYVRGSADWGRIGLEGYTGPRLQWPLSC